MGWHGHKLTEEWSLFTRGGIQGVFVKKNDSYEEIPIPESLLRMLVAEEIRASKIRHIEQAEESDLLGF